MNLLGPAISTEGIPDDTFMVLDILDYRRGCQMSLYLQEILM